MEYQRHFGIVVLGGLIILCIGNLAVIFMEPPSPVTLELLGYLAVIIVSGLALKLPLATRTKVSLVVFSIAATLFLVEIGLFLGKAAGYRTTKRRADAVLAQQQVGPFDTRTRLQMISELAAEGHEVSSRIPPSTFIPSNGLPSEQVHVFPLAGIANQQTLQCNESGEWIIFESDDHGFRNPKGIYEKREIDVVLVGDSFAYGACVKEDPGALLRSDDRTVLNLGYGGNGPLIELAALSEFGSTLTPKIVLWVYYEGNDLENLNQEKTSPLLTSYLTSDFSQSLSDRQSEVDELLRDYELRERRLRSESRRIPAWLCIPRLCGWRKLLSTAIERRLMPLSLFSDVLSTANRRVTDWGGKMYFVYLPKWQRYEDVSDWDRASHRTEVLSLVRALEIPVVDFHEVVSAHDDPLSLFPFRNRFHSHYTAEGYQLLAQQIQARLEEGKQ